MDQDQAVFAFMHARQPHDFDLYYVHRDWGRVVADF